MKDVERLAQQDASAAGVPILSARYALNQLCELEGAQLVTLTEHAKAAAVGREEEFFEVQEVQALVNHPLIRDLLYYTERVALRIGTQESWKVFAVYLAILDYAGTNPDWAVG